MILNSFLIFLHLKNYPVELFRIIWNYFAHYFNEIIFMIQCYYFNYLEIFHLYFEKKI